MPLVGDYHSACESDNNRYLCMDNDRVNHLGKKFLFRKKFLIKLTHDLATEHQPLAIFL